MKNPQTGEHFEAAQKEANELRKQLLNKMTPEQKKEFKIVETCVKKLSKNNILFYMSAFLHHPERNKKITWQYNSLGEHVTFDKNDKIDDKSKELIGTFIAGQLNNIFYEACNFHLDKNATFKEKWEFFQKYLYNALVEYGKYCSDNKDNTTQTS